MKGLSWANFVLGLWLIAAPFALLYRGISSTLWEDVIVGLLIAGFSLWRVLSSETAEMATVSWIVAGLGIWTLITPFVLHYNGNTTAMGNNVGVGVVVAVLAVYQAVSRSGMRPAQQHRGAH